MRMSFLMFYKYICKPVAILVIGAAALLSSSRVALAQQTGQFVEPIYRVAHEEATQQPAQVATRIPVQQVQSGLDLTPIPGQHPLMPALLMAKKALGKIDANIQDYSAMLYKQERINGELAGQEVAFIKVRHQPFGVYMFFVKPNKGRECLYNHAPDGAKGKLVAMDCGWKRRFGKLELDPEGHLAMKGQKYPIMKLGLRNLTAELIEVASSDVNFGECEVRTVQSKINGRAVTMIEAVHPVPRKNFRFHKAEIFIDNELHVPVRYAAYLWPENPDEAPPLEEAYTYLNLEVNKGFTNADFDPENPNYFKN